MVNMKSIKLLLFVVSSLLTLFACESFLEEVDPNRVTANNFFTTPVGLRDAIDGVYAPMRDWIGLEEHYTFTVFGTDTFTEAADESSSWSSKQFNRYNSDLNPLSEKIQLLWEVCYRGINNANTAINRSQEVDMPEEEKNDLLGQARFLRAYYYFWLVRNYGGVPIKLDETVGVETGFSRSSTDEVLSTIIEDLEFAAANLSTNPVQFGRPSTWAARNFLALAYLTRGRDASDYQRAFGNAQEVINRSPHRLLFDYADLWKLENQQNDEVIWSVQFSSVESNNGGDGNRGHLFFLMEYDLAKYHMERDVENGRPFKRFRPTNYLLDLYEENDPRFNASFKNVWYCNSEARLPNDGRLAIGDTCIYLPRKPLTDSEKEAKPYTVINPDEYDSRTFPSLRKFDQPDRVDQSDRDGSRDFIVFRLAETYLIAAEAEYRLNGGGLGYLNTVRRRAKQSELTSIDMNIILDERARELAGEGKRWFDLVRSNALVERVRQYNPVIAAENINVHHVLRPLPQSEIDIVDSDNFTQNSGY